MRKHRDINLITNEARRNYLASKPNNHAAKNFSENLLAIEIIRSQILMNQPVYLVLSIMEMSETVMCEFWYDHVKPKYGEKAMLRGYRQLCSLFKNKRYFCRHCKRC